MSQLSPVLRDTENNGLMFWCPGCKSSHRIQHGAGTGPRWSWNGDVNKPVFGPSVLVTGRDFTDKGEADFDAWHEAGCPLSENGKAPEFESAAMVCHSFVGCNGAAPGQIIFLRDSTHALAGQVVDLAAWPT